MAFIAVLTLYLSSLAIADKDNGDECSCFRTNGTSAGYFLNHQFFDYRNIETSTAIPAVITGETNTSSAGVTSDYFTSEAFTSFWTAQNWNSSDTLHTPDSDATVLQINSPNNVYIDGSTDYSTYLTLRTSRLPTFQSVAEIDTTAQDYQYISARFMARVTGSPGACGGMFTYLANDNPDNVQEADIEILTSGPRDMVQYTNQPSVKDGDVVEGATVNSTNPGAVDWTQWMIYRLDWMPGLTTWYINGEMTAAIALQAPRDPAGLIVNMWGDGGSWTGNMSIYDQAYLQIQWIQVTYNTSEPATGSNGKRDFVRRSTAKGCGVVCSIDEQVNVTGTPALLYNNTGMATIGWKEDGMGNMVWISVVLIGGMLFRWI